MSVSLCYVAYANIKYIFHNIRVHWSNWAVYNPPTNTYLHKKFRPGGGDIKVDYSQPFKPEKEAM